MRLGTPSGDCTAYRGKEIAGKRPSGAFRRQVQKVLAPSADCYEELVVGGVHFWAGCLEKIFAFACENSLQYRAAVLAAPERLSLIWYSDETTGGNVVATSQSKKAYLFYVCIFEVGHLSSPDAWLPYSCIPSFDVKAIGGLAAVSKVLGERLMKQLQGDMFLLGRQVSFEVRAIAGDYDALADLWSGKSATGVKPCILCQNCVNRHQKDAVKVHSYFRPTTCFAFDEFQPIKDSELTKVYDKFLKLWPSMQVGARQEAERQLGFCVDSTGVLASSDARAIFPLSKACFDVMHVYFSNGIASKEMLFLQRALQRDTSASLDLLATQTLQLQWHCQAKPYRSASSIRRLFREAFWTGNFFKAEASAVWVLLPLMGYFASALAPNLPELHSFTALLQVLRILRDVRRGFRKPQDMEAPQRQHLEAFLQMYTEKEVIPKHHFSLHIPHCWRATCVVDCWAMEARHKVYKNELCNDLQSLLEPRSGRFSHALVHRALHRCLEGTTACWHARLQGRVWDPEDVERETGLRCRIAKTFAQGTLELSSDDILFMGHLEAGVLQYFAEENNEFFALYKPLLECSSSLPNSRRFQECHVLRCLSLQRKDLWQPTWWRRDGANILTLL